MAEVLGGSRNRQTEASRQLRSPAPESPLPGSSLPNRPRTAGPHRSQPSPFSPSPSPSPAVHAIPAQPGRTNSLRASSPVAVGGWLGAASAPGARGPHKSPLPPPEYLAAAGLSPPSPGPGHGPTVPRDPSPTAAGAAASPSGRPMQAQQQQQQQQVDRSMDQAVASPSGHHESGSGKRPQTAPPLRTTGGGPQLQPGGQQLQQQQQGMGALNIRAYGKASLFDHEHEYLGAKILRDYSPPQRGLPAKGPDEFLRKGGAKNLKARRHITDWLKEHPLNREMGSPFHKGSGGVHFSSEEVPSANTIFRHLYDNGTLDFVTVRWGQENSLWWGRWVKRGVMAWDPSPAEVEVAKWLPIFVEGVREYDEPYRFMAIRGSEQLVLEAGARLHQCAVDLVPPLRKALITREPTVVATACELMRLCLRTDAQVAQVWLPHFWQFAQVFNHFRTLPLRVDLGYGSRAVRALKQVIEDILILLEEHGGPDATATIRKYARGWDPAVTSGYIDRLASKRADKIKPFKPFLLF